MVQPDTAHDGNRFRGIRSLGAWRSHRRRLYLARRQCSTADPHAMNGAGEWLITKYLPVADPDARTIACQPSCGANLRSGRGDKFVIDQ